MKMCWTTWSYVFVHGMDDNVVINYLLKVYRFFICGNWISIIFSKLSLRADVLVDYVTLQWGSDLSCHLDETVGFLFWLVESVTRTVGMATAGEFIILLPCSTGSASILSCRCWLRASSWPAPWCWWYACVSTSSIRVRSSPPNPGTSWVSDLHGDLCSLCFLVLDHVAIQCTWCLIYTTTFDWDISLISWHTKPPRQSWVVYFYYDKYPGNNLLPNLCFTIPISCTSNPAQNFSIMSLK